MSTTYITIICSLLSGLIAALVTIFVNKRSEKKRVKKELAVAIFGSRHQIMYPDYRMKQDFCKAMNSIPAVFSKDKNVLIYYDKLFAALDIKDDEEKSKKSQEALLNLMKAVCKAVDIDCSDWNDSRIQRIFQ